jgi:cell division protein FtsQ
MPAAAVHKGRPSAGGRSASAPGRTRGRAGPATAPPPSKLRATQAVGLRAPVAAAAAALLAVLILAAGLATGGRGARLVAMAGEGAGEAARGLSAVPGFARGGVESLGLKVREVHLQGASPAAQAEILAAAGVKPGQSITALDLAAVRARVEAVGWVAAARVVRLWPGTVVVIVDQRPLIALWQHAGRVAVIASNGAVVQSVDPAHFKALPLVVGEGANLAAAAVLPELSRHPKLWSRLSAVVRVDGRRWNLRLVDGAVVLLPEAPEAAALNRLDALEASSRILDLGLARIDLRDPDMVVVRPRGAVAPPAASRG